MEKLEWLVEGTDPNRVRSAGAVRTSTGVHISQNSRGNDVSDPESGYIRSCIMYKYGYKSNAGSCKDY